MSSVLTSYEKRDPLCSCRRTPYEAKGDPFGLHLVLGAGDHRPFRTDRDGRGPPAWASHPASARSPAPNFQSLSRFGLRLRDDQLPVERSLTTDALTVPQPVDRSPDRELIRRPRE